MQRTTAGTRAAVAARQADQIFCASFVCATATAAAVRELAPRDVTIVISGGLFAEEDLACGELIARLLAGDRPDSAHYVERALSSDAAADLRRGVDRGFTGVSPEDVQMCVDVDRFSFAMAASRRHGHLVLSRLPPVPAI